jgi:hypothetical protein
MTALGISPVERIYFLTGHTPLEPLFYLYTVTS